MLTCIIHTFIKTTFFYMTQVDLFSLLR